MPDQAPPDEPTGPDLPSGAGGPTGENRPADADASTGAGGSSSDDLWADLPLTSSTAQVWDPERRQWVDPPGAASGSAPSATSVDAGETAPGETPTPVWDADRGVWIDGYGLVYDEGLGEWIEDEGIPGGHLMGVDDVYVPVRASGGGQSRWLVVGLSLMAFVAIGLLSVGWWVRGQIDPGSPGEAVEFTVPAGSTTADIARLLETKGVIGNPTVFEWYLRFNGGGPFKAGDYEGLRENQSMGDVIDILDAGPLPPRALTIAFPEGLWLVETRQRILDTFPEMDPAALDVAIAETRAPIMPDDVDFPDGVLFPATYEVANADVGDPRKLLDQMILAFERVSVAQGLPDATAKLEGVAGRREITPYEALIVASLVESEARVPQDRAKIARVIYNRIAEGMRLDIDATVLFALGDRQAALTDSSLRVDSPYNTRRYDGFPPTPINSPGEASIEAALNPADGDWLFYVLADEDGSHYFTNDFDDFNRAASEARDKGLL